MKVNANQKEAVGEASKVAYRNERRDKPQTICLGSAVSVTVSKDNEESPTLRCSHWRAR